MTRPAYSLFIPVALLFALSARAEKVILVGKAAVAVGQRRDRPWKVGDEACLYRDGDEVACGVVRKVSRKGAILQLKSRRTAPRKGDTVRAKGAAAPPAAAEEEPLPPEPPAEPPPAKSEEPPPPEETAKSGDQLLDEIAGKKEEKVKPPPQAMKAKERPEAMPEDVKVEAEIRRFHFWAGGDASPNYVVVLGGFEFHMLTNLAIGVTAGYLGGSTSSTSLSAIPVLFQLSFYNHGDFEGLWVRLAGGVQLYSISGLTTNESPTTPLALATLGWRFGFNSLTLGLALGAQYMPEPVSTNVVLGFSSVQPVGTAELGLKF